MSLAREKDIRIPQDIKVLGFDNIDIAQFMDLSSVSQNLDESGRLAANLVLGQIQNPESSVCSMTLELKIVERATSKVLAD